MITWCTGAVREEMSFCANDLTEIMLLSEALKP